MQVEIGGDVGISSGHILKSVLPNSLREICGLWISSWQSCVWNPEWGPVRLFLGHNTVLSISFYLTLHKYTLSLLILINSCSD